VGLIFDLAVAALAVAVVASLALLAWTLAISVVRAVQRGRRQVAGLRAWVTDAEAWLPPAAARASTALAELSDRIEPGDQPHR
jgi:uncharacterized NAD-dependent epimerase/dehydratase family protein